MSIIPKHGFDIEGPTSAPNVAPDRANGNMAAGTYRYKISYVNRYGETLAGPVSLVVTPVAGSVLLTNIPVHPLGNVVSRNIYRTAVGGALPYRLIGSIGDNITTTYTDIANDSGLGAVEPIKNFAPSVGIERGWTVLSRPAIHPFDVTIVAAGNSYATATRCSQTGEYFLVSVPLNLNGIILPPVTPDLVGMVVVVKNTSGANDLNVYPEDSTGQINVGGTGIPRVVKPGVVEEFLASTTLAWQVITSSGASTGVTSFDGGATGLTPAVPSGGTVSLGGTLNVSHGGTGITIIPNGAVIYGNGAAPVGTTVGTAGQLLVSGGTFAPTWSGTVTFNGTTITGVPNPTNIGDIVNKSYVDALTTGFNVHAAVQLATTGALTVLYNNGAGGIGATLTNNGPLAPLQIDTITVLPGQRILVKNQATPQQNGVYDVTTVGTGLVPWVLTRSDDFNNSPPGEVMSGDFIFVELGPANGATGWVQTTVGTGPGGSIIMGTNPLTFTQFSNNAAYLAGTGLNLLGNTFNNTGVLSVSGGTTGLTFAPSTGNSVMSGILLPANGGTGTTAGIDVVLDGSAAPKYPQDLTSGVWYGTGTKAAGNSSTVRLGNIASATGNNSVAIGNAANANGQESIALGNGAGNAGATGARQTCVGPSSGGGLTSAADVLCLGSNATCGPTVTGATAVGLNSVANATNSVAVGTSATADGVSSIAIGTSSRTGTGIDNTTIGISSGYISNTGTQNQYFGREVATVGCTFTGTITGGTTLTLNSVASGTFVLGMTITGAGVTPGVTIVSLASGSLGANASTYVITASANVAAVAMTGYSVGTGNNLIGYRAGRYVLGNNNLVAGNTAAAALITGGGNVILGSGANTDTAERNDAVVLGNGITSISGAGAHDGGLYSQHYAGVVVGNAAVWVGNELVEAVSSQRYKDNIRPLGDVSEKFMKLEPVRYTGKDDPAKAEQIGLIAESVEKLFPEFVVYKEFEEEGVRPHGLSYDRMVAVLIQQVQKLTAEVEALKAERK